MKEKEMDTSGARSLAATRQTDMRSSKSRTYRKKGKKYPRQNIDKGKQIKIRAKIRPSTHN